MPDDSRDEGGPSLGKRRRRSSHRVTPFRDTPPGGMAIAGWIAVDRELSRKLLQRACEVAGGAERLSERLEVDRHALEFWASGRATPPEHIIFAAIDLVLDDDIARAAQDRRKNVVQRAIFGPLHAVDASVTPTLVAILPANTIPDLTPQSTQPQTQEANDTDHGQGQIAAAAFPLGSATASPQQATQNVPVRGQEA